MAFALFEIMINLQGRYLGEYFDRQSYYQLAAKAHEIFIDASLASIVLSYIRYELTIGEGIPFGAFLGSLQFSSVSYLWSRELWSSLFASDRKIRRFAFFVLVVICGIIAATAGPSSATLLIPRQTLWSVDPSYVLINGTFEDVWPHLIDAQRVPQDCSVVSSSATQGNYLCPGAAWESIFEEIGGTGDNNLTGFLEPGILADSIIWALSSPRSELIFGDFSNCPSNRTALQICGVTEPLILTDAAFNNSNFWDYDDGYAYNDLFHSVTKGSYAAYSAIQCLHDTIDGPKDSTAIRFPNLFRTKEQYAHAVEAVPFERITKAEVYASTPNISEFHMIWTDLAEELFGGIVSGLILIEPRKASSSPQNISTCSVSVGWGTSSIEEDLEEGDVNTSPNNIPAPLKYLKIDRADGEMGLPFYGPIFANESGFAYPQLPIRLAVDWLELLNPVTELPDGTNTTVVNAYMSVFSERLPAFSLAQLLTYMLSGGLSIIGLDLAWQGKFKHVLL